MLSVMYRDKKYIFSSEYSYAQRNRKEVICISCERCFTGTFFKYERSLPGGFVKSEAVCPACHNKLLSKEEVKNENIA